MLLMDFIVFVLAIIGVLAILFVIFNLIINYRDKKEQREDYQGQINSLQNSSRFLMTQLSIVNRIALRCLSTNTNYNHFSDEERKELIRFLKSIEVFEKYVIIDENTCECEENRSGFLNFKEYILVRNKGFYSSLFDLRFITNRVKRCLETSNKILFVNDIEYYELKDDLKKINNILEHLNIELETKEHLYRK